ncbi:cytoplasmic tRNA 2-thiolation protein 1 isoform X1 [Plodia interpunctella]|uniref:cytoplasmic tRNA 2-thiolation protein 1 isoform X1 n=1 Tax=Plodia interpunctella TaxID=58824 RepID=UPI0023675A8A|nr:cytoplasmic tRNA 2-thiolation protein 1 isoform X1 [Plodia interpunctella]
MPVLCGTGCGKNAVLKRPKTGDALCKDCFYWAFETEIHYTITKSELFNRGDSVAVAASGGKDSTVLAHVLKTLNSRYDYGLNLTLLSIDEGITGYRDDSLETVKQNRDDYEMPLKILSYKDLYGWTMDEIVAQIGRKNNCTFCGVFRRQALDRGAAMLGVKCIATGHNADDIAETVLMNVLRGDIARLKRCTAISTGSEGTIPRVKPLKYTYEKEIVMYAHYKKLVYFSTECIFAPNAYRGHARALLKDMEKIRPACIMDIIYSGETMAVKDEVSLPTQRTCVRCHFVSSQEVCKACVLLEGLNKGLPRLGIGKSSKAKKMLDEYHSKQNDALKSAVLELSDVNNEKSRMSRKCCKSGACNKIDCKETLTNGSDKCNSKQCCSGKCSSKDVDPAANNAKLNNLLEQYELDNSQASDRSSGQKETNIANRFEDDKSHNEETNGEEEDLCSASCGRLGSLQIGF